MNPYEILGVSENVTDEELNKVYKQLARKYHPDINKSPDAEKKMVEINCAYDEIKKMRAEGKTYDTYKRERYDYSSSSSSGYNAYAAENDQIYTQLEQYLRAGRNFEAFFILQSVLNHDARWYYYSAYLYCQMGQYPTALQFIDQAILMDPGNSVYINYKNVINVRLDMGDYETEYKYQGSTQYRNSSYHYEEADSNYQSVDKDFYVKKPEVPTFVKIIRRIVFWVIMGILSMVLLYISGMLMSWFFETGMIY